MRSGSLAGWSGLLEDTTTALRKTAEAAEAQEWAALVKRQSDRADSAENFNAANLAMKYAALEALRKLDPNHPLVTNADLRDRIHKAGVMAFSINRNFDDARDAGATFKI